MTEAVAAPSGSAPRERLLAATVEHVARHGLADLSLRALAEAIGTSHRMLIYHFGSKEGLLAEVVATVEAGQRAVLAELASSAEPPGVAVRRFWRGLTDPSVREHERLFFEIVAQALQGRPGTEGLRESLVEPWLDVVAEQGVRLGLDPGTARAQARLGMAVTRGLLLDLLATGDLDGVDAAMDLFLDAFVPLPAGRRLSSRRLGWSVRGSRRGVPPPRAAPDGARVPRPVARLPQPARRDRSSSSRASGSRPAGRRSRADSGSSSSRSTRAKAGSSAGPARPKRSPRSTTRRSRSAASTRPALSPPPGR